MKVSHHPASERGVTQLMYVGDDGLPQPDPNRLDVAELGIVFAAGYGAAKTRGVLRLGLLGIALATIIAKSKGGSIIPGG